VFVYLFVSSLSFQIAFPSISNHIGLRKEDNQAWRSETTRTVVHSNFYAMIFDGPFRILRGGNTKEEADTSAALVLLHAKHSKRPFSLSPHKPNLDFQPRSKDTRVSTCQHCNALTLTYCMAVVVSVSDRISNEYHGHDCFGLLHLL
jgi:hypothetical protein